MKNTKKILILLLAVLLAFSLAACDLLSPDHGEDAPGDTPGDDPKPDIPTTEVTIEVQAESIRIQASEIETYDFLSLFCITEDGKNVPVVKDFLNLSDLKTVGGKYTLICTYGGKRAGIAVEVIDASLLPTVTTVEAKVENITIKDREVADFDPAAWFTVTFMDEEVTPGASAFSTDLAAVPGNYYVMCNYNTRIAIIGVTVEETVWQVKASVPSLTLREKEAEGYDFKALFSVTMDGEKVDNGVLLFDDPVVPVAGTYTVSASVAGASASVSVTVLPDVIITVHPAFDSITVEQGMIASYGFASLFTVWENETAVRTLPEMLDLSAVTDEIGAEFDISCTHTVDRDSGSASIRVTVVPDAALTVSVKNAVTGPNSTPIDLTKLFTLKRGEVEIPVTSAMLSGEVDYVTPGVYQIALSYEDVKVTAEVEVKRGVVLSYKRGDTVGVKLGTDPAKYDFSKDFNVMINGVSFDLDLYSYMVLDGVDFNTAGTYTATLKIAYNDSADNIYKEGTGIRAPKNVHWIYSELPITYNVVANNYLYRIKEETVILEQGTTSYNPFRNIILEVNGINQTLTDDPKGGSIVATYAEVVSDPIDFDSPAKQTVSIALYIDGPNAAPVIVSFTVQMKTGIKVTPHDVAVFTGVSVTPADLFEITENGRNVTVTADMLTGKLDLFAEGIYTLTLNYQGAEATATVTVYDRSLIGTYKTPMTTIPAEATSSSSSGSWDGNYGDGEDEEEIVEKPVTGLSSLKIRDDGSIVYGQQKATDVVGIDLHTMTLCFGSSSYTLYVNDGILLLIPDNSFRMSFTETRRPILFFNTDLWTVTESFTLNSRKSGYVLSSTVKGYSIDCAHILSKDGKQDLWYGMKTDLTDRTGADTVYKISWGEVTFGESSHMEKVKDEMTGLPTGEQVEVTDLFLTYDGEDYPYVMASQGKGVVLNAEEISDAKPYANMTFNGTVGGAPAKLSANVYQNWTLNVDGNTEFSLALNDLSAMTNGGVNTAENTVFLYAFNRQNKPTYDEGEYSYKFILDTEAKTFTVVERDAYYGRYVCDGAQFFIDGYGTGHATFDFSSYATTCFRYTVENGEMKITYINPAYNFEYGTEAVFYVGPFLNTLYAKDIGGEKYLGKTFVNVIITDGAIVTQSHTAVSKSSTAAADLIADILSITTANGELTVAEKKAMLDVSAILPSKPGFYQFTLTLNVGGNHITAYYAIQILNA